MRKREMPKWQRRRRAIRVEMYRRGITGAEIGRQLGISPQAVYQCCATSPRIIAALQAAGMPGRFFEEG